MQRTKNCLAKSSTNPGRRRVVADTEEVFTTINEELDIKNFNYEN
jgi:hypothetical protein